MKIKINRFKNIHDGTIGKLTITDDGKRLFECFTLEPAGADTTQRGKDRRIPAGRYLMQWYASPSQKRMCPLLYNELVPKDRYILIHPGNFPQDTAGCILVGENYTAAGVTNSVKTFNALFKICIGKHIEFIEITSEGGAYEPARKHQSSRGLSGSHIQRQPRKGYDRIRLFGSRS